jgi:hypothetical protein
MCVGGKGETQMKTEYCGGSRLISGLRLYRTDKIEIRK